MQHVIRKNTHERCSLVFFRVRFSSRVRITFACGDLAGFRLRNEYNKTANLARIDLACVRLPDE